MNERRKEGRKSRDRREGDEEGREGGGGTSKKMKRKTVDKIRKDWEYDRR